MRAPRPRDPDRALSDQEAAREVEATFLIDGASPGERARALSLLRARPHLATTNRYLAALLQHPDERSTG